MKLRSARDLVLERGFRVALSLFLLIGHGIPKVSFWLFGIVTWGNHATFVPKGLFPGIAALIEFICPILIILGIHVRWAALPVVMMFVGFAFSKPLPWYYIGVPVEGYALPKAVIISKEVVLAYALAYLSLTLFAKNKDPIWKRPNADL